MGTGLVVLYREPGNGYSRALDRRRPCYCSHRHASVLLPSKGREHVVRLERGLSAFPVKSSSQTFYSVKTCQELGMLPGSQRCPDARGSSMAVAPSSHEFAPPRPKPSPALADDALACAENSSPAGAQAAPVYSYNC